MPGYENKVQIKLPKVDNLSILPLTVELDENSLGQVSTKIF